MSESERVIRALKKVPEKQLLLLDLAQEAVDTEGELNYQMLADRQREVNLAVAEATAYCEATTRAVRSLRRLQARVGNE